jgi:hypothetical protein
MTLEELIAKRKHSIIVVCTLGLAATPFVENIRDSKRGAESHGFKDWFYTFLMFFLYLFLFTVFCAVFAFVVHFFKLIYYSIEISYLKNEEKKNLTY